MLKGADGKFARLCNVIFVDGELSNMAISGYVHVVRHKCLATASLLSRSLLVCDVSSTITAMPLLADLLAVRVNSAHLYRQCDVVRLTLSLCSFSTTRNN